MGERFVALFLKGLHRVAAALGDYWRWRTTPPAGARQDDTHTDQW